MARSSVASRTAGSAADDDKLDAEILGEAPADGQGVVPLDAAQVGVDEYARPGVADGVEMGARRQRSGLAVLAA